MGLSISDNVEKESKAEYNNAFRIFHGMYMLPVYDIFFSIVSC